MQDEDYSVYLKKQSYDGLVSISCSIDKEGQAKRYEMVLAEMAERDKRGEKPEVNWRSSISFGFGVFYIGRSILELVMSRTGPSILHLAFGVVGLSFAWFSRKKGEDEKRAA